MRIRVKSNQLCQCGCGQYTLMCVRDKRKSNKFIYEHLRGLGGADKMPEVMLKKLVDRNKSNTGPRKGDDLTYASVHKWIRDNWGRANKCEICHIKNGRFEWANLTGRYLRSKPEEWKQVCRFCHQKIDRPNIKGWKTRRANPVYYEKMIKNMSLGQKKPKWKRRITCPK